MAVLKQESLDDNEEALVPASRCLQKVPSISDLSDPEASLGKLLLFSFKFHFIFLIRNCYTNKNKNK